MDYQRRFHHSIYGNPQKNWTLGALDRLGALEVPSALASAHRMKLRGLVQGGDKQKHAWCGKAEVE